VRCLWVRAIPLALAVLTVACGDDPSTPSADRIDGSYAATIFTLADGHVVTDQLAKGAVFSIRLWPDRTTTGRLFVPGLDEGGADFDADLTGTWTVHGGTVNFAHSADTFVRDMPFTVAPDQLRGEATFDNVTVRVILTRT